MTTVKTFAWICLLAPLAGFILNALLFRVTRGRMPGYIATGFMVVSFAAAVVTLISLQGLSGEDRQVQTVAWDLANTVGVDAQISLLIDPLALFMMLVVSGVSTLIHLYAVSYMGSDRGYTRFFSYLNFFVFSMLLLVMAGNFVLLIIGWAFVGAASYLLISFWFRRETATRAGIKAFVINVVGDVGLVLGTFFIFRSTGTLNFLDASPRCPTSSATTTATSSAGCSCCSSARSRSPPRCRCTRGSRTPWRARPRSRPDRRGDDGHRGRLPHRAHVAAVRRSPPRRPPSAQDRALTMFVAATIALTQTDLKRVIAYSTMSQIGYMIMAVSSGAYVAGLFHLMTHAFFKALLFMAAGSVISAMAGAQNLDKMGGFRKAMPFTFGCFIVGGLALAGVPPFSGFFSKDEILAAVGSEGGWHVILAVLGYSRRVHDGGLHVPDDLPGVPQRPVPEARELEEGHLHHVDVHTNPVSGEVEDTDVGFPGPDHHIAEREPSMKVAMTGLAILTIIGGFIQIPFVDHVLESFLEPTFAGSELFETVHPSDGLTIFGLTIGSIIALTGIGLAYLIWVKHPGTSERIRLRVKPLYTFSFNKWYFEQAIDFLIVRPAKRAGGIAGSVIERGFIDKGITGGTSGAVRAGSAAVRAVQTGFLRYYAALIVVGMIAVTAYFLIQT